MRSRLTAASEHRRGEQADLDQDRLRRTTSARAPRGSACGDRRADARARAGRSTETNATFEKRGTTTESPATRRPAGRLAQTTSRPTSPPSQIEPETRWSQSSRSERPRGAVCAAWPDGAGDERAPPPRRRARAEAAEELGDRAVLALGPVDPERDPRGDAEEREADLHVDVAAPERRHAEQRHERADVEDRAQRVDRGRDVEVDRDREQPERPRATTNAIETARRLVPSTRRTSGRAIASRSTKRPIAIITVRNTSPARDERAAVVVAVSAMRRHRELRLRARRSARSRR